MELVKNIELVKDFIGGFIYNFNYDLLMHSVLMRIKVINYKEMKIYEVRLELAAQIEYSVLEDKVGVSKIKSFEVNKGKYIDKIWGDEEEMYIVSMKIWGDELNIKCRNVIINLIAD